eukprot:CAMPEP_0177696012 /NCGR_PEP_ID=MMETSP0484_2-20121128/3758_1 /TAXON_ID=354590 /ORGANISM="Rhodomonas lens, Strain RHODO" /LENGTH=137 /DNA_ID=CAMNT_0019206965 /DNA_START=453 /DNA_END=863 /DNA_ORIENTATION=-
MTLDYVSALWARGALIEVDSAFGVHARALGELLALEPHPGVVEGGDDFEEEHRVPAVVRHDRQHAPVLKCAVHVDEEFAREEVEALRLCVRPTSLLRGLRVVDENGGDGAGGDVVGEDAEGVPAHDGEVGEALEHRA